MPLIGNVPTDHLVVIEHLKRCYCGQEEGIMKYARTSNESRCCDKTVVANERDGEA
jgi:hypothetical protein